MEIISISRYPKHLDTGYGHEVFVADGRSSKFPGHADERCRHIYMQGTDEPPRNP